MADDVIPTISSKEIRTTKLGIAGAAAQGQTSSTNQSALSTAVSGTYGLDSSLNMAKLHGLVVEIRRTLVANGMMKGSA